MSSQEYPLRQSGIYRNLPSFDPSIKGLKAIICGATGISGFHTLRALLDIPDRWTKIYAISRSPIPERQLSLLTEEQQGRIQHISIDLQSSGTEIAQKLEENRVTADYVFYYSYLHPKCKPGESAMSVSMAEALVSANVPIFRNFLAALTIANIQPKRILLQTGGKNYGMHVGRVRTPVVESDPQPRHLAPNFYYEQEELLFHFCAQHPETKWNVVRPAAVIGSATDTAMSTFLPFAIYAAVQARRGERLVFGGDFSAWQHEGRYSTARLTGYLSEWAVLEDRCENQSFNAQDGGALSWDRFFEELGRWFGVTRDAKGPEEDAEKYDVNRLAGGENSPLGYGPPLDLRHSFKLAEWAQEPANPKAWEEIMIETNIKFNPFDLAPEEVFMGDYTYLPFGSLSIHKARRFGFNGYVDSLESIFESFQEMDKLGILPQMKVDAARPLG